MSARDYLDKDFYAVLGVTKDADADQLKKAYRTLARQYHPDANAGDAKAEEKFKEISEAYDVLSDDAKRREYDEMRQYGATFGGGGFGPGGGGGFGPAGASTVNLGDLFGDSGLGDMLGGLFGGRGGGGRSATKGEDLTGRVTLSFRDAASGVATSISLRSEAACPTCHGSAAPRQAPAPHTCSVCGGSGQTVRQQGGFGFAEPCRACHGRGQVVDDPCATCSGVGVTMQSRTVNVRIPAGVKGGATLRIPGKGAPDRFGGPAGDLLVTVHVRKHPVFGRKGTT